MGRRVLQPVTGNAQRLASSVEALVDPMPNRRRVVTSVLAILE